MARGITIQQIAETVGVSKSTVSRALANNPRISEELRARIRETAAGMDYIPNVVARGLAEGLNRIIGMVVFDIANPYFAGLVKGAETEADKHGYSILLCNSGEHSSIERRQVERMEKNRVAGLLLSVVNPGAEHIVRLRMHGFPFVLFDRFPDEEESSYVSVDRVDGLYQATDYLIGLGHQRIALIALTRTASASLYSIEGYSKAFARHQLPFVKQLICYSKEGTTQEAYRIARVLLDLPADRRPTAICTVNDVQALGVYRAAYDLGWSIPQDLSIVGYDDIPTVDLLPIPLTTVAQPMFEQGRMAAEILTKMITDPAGHFRQHVFIRPKLITRSSCAPPSI